jgi:hypothetical protein
MGEHLGVRDRAPDVVLEEPTIKGDRFRELFHPTVRLGIKPTAPGLISQRCSPLAQDTRAKNFGMAYLF